MRPPVLDTIMKGHRTGETMSRVKIGDYILTTDHKDIDDRYQNLIGVVTDIGTDLMIVNTNVKKELFWTISNQDLTWIHLGPDKPLIKLLMM